MGFCMQGQNDTQQQLFHTVELDSFIPNSHLLKKVNRLIDFNFMHVFLDLTFRVRLSQVTLFIYLNSIYQSINFCHNFFWDI